MPAVEMMLPISVKRCTCRLVIILTLCHTAYSWVFCLRYFINDLVACFSMFSMVLYLSGLIILDIPFARIFLHVDVIINDCRVAQ